MKTECKYMLWTKQTLQPQVSSRETKVRIYKTLVAKHGY